MRNGDTGSERRPIYCFSHIQKAAGTSIEAVLRRHFGLRHMLVNPPVGWIYRPGDLVADLRVNPLLRSISGHWLRPFTDFGPLEPRLQWYTFLREPIARVLSHYQYHVEHMGVERTLEAWLREDPMQQNWQTRYLAGSPDLERARHMLDQRYRFVGFTERFDESLVLMRHFLGLDSMSLWYGRPHNVARSDARKARIREEFEAIRDVVIELNSLDIELYRFAVEEVSRRQVEAFGGETQLSKSVREVASAAPRPAGRLNELMFLAYRRVVHLPIQQRRSRQARARGRPDERY